MQGTSQLQGGKSCGGQLKDREDRPGRAVREGELGLLAVLGLETGQAANQCELRVRKKTRKAPSSGGEDDRSNGGKEETTCAMR